MQKLQEVTSIGPGDWVWVGEVKRRNKINPLFGLGSPADDGNIEVGRGRSLGKGHEFGFEHIEF